MKNKYDILISSANPCLILYLIDQSESMVDKFGNSTTSKATELASAINDVIYQIGLRCLDDGDIKNRFEVALFGYGGDTVKPGWQGTLGKSYVHPINEILMNPVGTTPAGVPYWIEPKGEGGTPMLQAFKNAKELCKDWINWKWHKDSCHPPIVINITDGEATDDRGDFSGIRAVTDEIKSMETDYGNTLLLNIHISTKQADRKLFPSTLNAKTKFESMLFEISSVLPEPMKLRAEELYPMEDNARGYIFNGNGVDLINFLNVGSSPGGNGGRLR